MLCNYDAEAISDLGLALMAHKAAFDAYYDAAIEYARMLDYLNNKLYNEHEGRTADEAIKMKELQRKLRESYNALSVADRNVTIQNQKEILR